jgi:uncharacterized protein (UPF0147 family)
MEQFETLFPAIINHTPIQRAESSQPFIVSNTLETTMDEMRNDHIIPVFTKDNETLISHVEFIEKVWQMVAEIYHGETVPKYGEFTHLNKENKKTNTTTYIIYFNVKLIN